MLIRPRIAQNDTRAYFHWGPKKQNKNKTTYKMENSKKQSSTGTAFFIRSCFIGKVSFDFFIRSCFIGKVSFDFFFEVGIAVHGLYTARKTAPCLDWVSTSAKNLHPWWKMYHLP